MKEQGLDPAAVSSVLLTHTDSDHTAALSLFSNADIYMSADEQQMIDGTTKRNLLTSNELSEETKSRIILVNENEVLELDISDDGMIFTAHYGVYKIEDIIK